MKFELEILHEDNHLLVLNKPSMIPTMGTGEVEPGLVGFARDYIGEKYQKPGKVFLGIVSRLDSWVSGAVVFARTSKSAARLNEQFRNRTIQKSYWAIVQQDPDSATTLSDSGSLEHLIGKNDREKRMVCIPPGSKRPANLEDLKEARLEYKTLAQNGDQILLEINLITGRKHQIRAQFAAVGWPVAGDRKYDSQIPFPTGLALHSHRLFLDHPTLRHRMDFRAKLPGYWPEFAKKMQ